MRGLQELSGMLEGGGDDVEGIASRGKGALMRASLLSTASSKTGAIVTRKDV